jgi:hypothetical protein
MTILSARIMSSFSEPAGQSGPVPVVLADDATPATSSVAPVETVKSPKVWTPQRDGADDRVVGAGGRPAGV